MKETIKNLREYFRFSQTQLAAMIGVSRQMYIKYENGEYEPNIKVLIALCRVYNVPYEVLIENKYKDGIPEKRDYKETISYKEIQQKNYDLVTSSVKNLNVAEPVAVYGGTKNNQYSTLQKIYDLLRLLGTNDRLKVISYIADTTRKEHEENSMDIKTNTENRTGTGYLNQKDSLKILEKFAGSIDRKDFDYKNEKLNYLDERFGI